jgi:hypothetical protein
MRIVTIAAGVALSLMLLTACKVGRPTVAQGMDQRFVDLTHAQQMEFMARVVVPEMKPRFQAFDAERFSTFGCKTCHGAGADDGSYAMPNPQLPHLRQRGFFKEHRAAHPDTVRFMWKQVEMPMGKLLGMTAGPAGELECGSCHVVDDRDP